MVKRTIHKLKPRIYYYTVGPNEPALVAKSGNTITAILRDGDGFNEKMEPISEERKQRSDITPFLEANPLVGPIYVEEAQPGDRLAVTIKRIRLNRNSAWAAPLTGLTGETLGEEPSFKAPAPESKFNWQLDLKRNIGILELEKSKRKQIEISLHPFLGSIGVAPRFGRVEISLTSGEYGGNMDCVETKEGTTIYLPVWVRGAYLFLGDIHAAQGDGEICGMALETTGEVTVELEVTKGKSIEWPRLENDTHIMTVGNGRPLMSCIRIAQVELVKWLSDDYGFERGEAFQIVSQIATIRIGNVVNPNYTVIMKFPKKYLTD